MKWARPTVALFVLSLAACGSRAPSGADGREPPSVVAAVSSGASSGEPSDESSVEPASDESSDATEAETSRTPTDLVLLAGTEAERCAVLFRSGLAPRLPLSTPPGNEWDPEGGSCFERAFRACPHDARCERGRAGRTEIVVVIADPAESGHDVPVSVLLTRPWRGFCWVLPRPTVRQRSPRVEDLDGDGRAELVWPHVITLRDDARPIVEITVPHPYALEGQDMVLRPALAADAYATEATALEQTLQHTQAECRAAGADQSAPCERNVVAVERLIDALRHAGSCTGAEGEAIAGGTP